VPFLILERRARAGGVILSEQIDGFTIDAGPDALLTQKPEAVALCRELGLGDRLVPTKPPRLAYIQRAGRLHALPAASVLGIPTRLGPFIGTRLFSWAGKLRMGAELFVPPRKDEGDESIGSFVTRRFGAEATTYLAEPLLAGIHAGDVNRLSIRALFPRFVQAEQTDGSLLRAFRRQARLAARKSGSPGDAADGMFRSLRGGLGELVGALVAALPVEAIRLESPVSRVGRDGGAFRVDTPSGPLDARAVVFAAPAYVTGDLTRDLDPELGRLCGEISYASTATVALGFDRHQVAHPLNGSGFVVPRVEATGILAASWMSSKWPGRAPDDRVLLRTVVGGARDPEAIGASDAELIDRSLRALRPLVGIRGEPILAKVYRYDRLTPQHEVGHVARLAAIERAIARHPGLFVTGAGFRGVGIPEGVADGRRTAGQVADWLRAHD
jgi:oxygen-dependent protoporphyrinogen oxidase